MSAAQKLRAENERLRLAIHRIAVEKGMWCVSGNNVIVSIDPTLTEAEREALEYARSACRAFAQPTTCLTTDEALAKQRAKRSAATIDRLLARHGGAS